MRASEIPKQCYGCDFLKCWTIERDGEGNYCCTGGRVPALEKNCDRRYGTGRKEGPKKILPTYPYSY